MRITTVFSQRRPFTTVVSARGARVDVTPGTALLAVTQVTTGLTGKSGAAVPGATGDLTHTHQQPTAADEWLVAHGLNKYPSVSIFDSAGDQVEGDVEHIDVNSLRIVFSAAFSGRAYLN